MRLLVFNAGSSSLKFELLELPAGASPRRLATGAFVDAADGTGRFVLRGAEPAQGVPPLKPPSVATLAEAAEYALQWLSDASVHGRDLVAGIAATVHRVVHGGERFRATTQLGEAELAALAELSPLAPLHNPPALSVITGVRRKLGADVPIIGVFDTAYYADLPEAAIQYAVPMRWRAEFGIRRYGFHGLAHRYLCQTVRTRIARVQRGGARGDPHHQSSARTRLLRDGLTRRSPDCDQHGIHAARRAGDGHALGRCGSGSGLVCHGARRDVRGRCASRAQ